jgi:hypothetical protein
MMANESSLPYSALQGQELLEGLARHRGWIAWRGASAIVFGALATVWPSATLAVFGLLLIVRPGAGACLAHRRLCDHFRRVAYRAGATSARPPKRMKHCSGHLMSEQFAKERA